MKTKRVSDEPKVVSPAVAALLKALFIVVMTTLFLLLAFSMKRHHFFSGGRNYQDRTSHPWPFLTSR